MGLGLGGHLDAHPCRAQVCEQRAVLAREQVVEQAQLHGHLVRSIIVIVLYVLGGR